MVHTLLSQAALFALLATSLFALIKAGAAERWGAILICLSWLGGDAVALLFKNILSQQLFELTLLVMDATLALGFLALALRFAKMWLGVAMLMQSCELALHGAAMADWGLEFQRYLAFNNLVSFGLLFLLAVATGIAWRQRVRNGRPPTASTQTSPLFGPQGSISQR
jgi:hypothetical protein